MLPIPGVSKLEMYGVIAVVLMLLAGGAFAYYKITTSEMAALKAQVATEQLRADTLSTTITQMTKDMATIKAATDQTNSDLAAIRDKAAIAARNARTQDLNTSGRTNSHALEAQVNKDVSSAFGALQDGSHAPK